ncbi:unnamed protein product [Cuscuta europaea]|uniref:Uncharacterized protein n=1 Tax=Cuscuta europaea TaxID=41803 RepID=A0A9P1E7B3_CUSEU|nr:unnamed protein product [Cuscuta europaea]
MGGAHLLSLFNSSSSGAASRLMSRLPAVVSESQRRLSNHHGGGGGVVGEDDKAATTEEEFKRVAEEKERCRRHRLASQTVDKAGDGAFEAAAAATVDGSSGSDFESVKETFKHDQPSSPPPPR